MISVKKVAYALTLSASVVAPVMSATAFAYHGSFGTASDLKPSETIEWYAKFICQF